MTTTSGKAAFAKEVLITFLIMLICFILLDLYVPIKRIVMGDSLNLSEILSYITLKHPFYVSVVLAVVLRFYRQWKK